MDTDMNEIGTMNRVARDGTAKRVSHHARGFTLIELLLVLVILAVLAALVVPKFTNRSKQARETAARTDISQIRSAVGRFEVDASRFPASLDELVVKPADVESWSQGLEKIPKDPWGNEYQYKVPGASGNDFDVYSFGADGREGGDDIYPK